MRAGTYRVSPCIHVMGTAVFWSGHGLITKGWASVTELLESSTADIVLLSTFTDRPGAAVGTAR